MDFFLGLGWVASFLPVACVIAFFHCVFFYCFRHELVVPFFSFIFFFFSCCLERVFHGLKGMTTHVYIIKSNTEFGNVFCIG